MLVSSSQGNILLHLATQAVVTNEGGLVCIVRNCAIVWFFCFLFATLFCYYYYGLFHFEESNVTMLNHSANFCFYYDLRVTMRYHFVPHLHAFSCRLLFMLRVMYLVLIARNKKKQSIDLNNQQLTTQVKKANP